MKSKVYFVEATNRDGADQLSEKSEKIFLQAGQDDLVAKDDFVALKIHFGEKGNTGYIKPVWLAGIIARIRQRTSRVFLTDTNTLYLGQRSNSLDHLRLAQEHGFSLESTGIPVVIADGLIGRDDDEVEVDLPRVKTAKIASVFLNTDVLVCLSHFTGHMLTGFGATIKNLGMGCASRAGKLEQHSDVHPWVNPKLCNNCAVCIDYCPTQAIVQQNGSAMIIDEKCIGCGECLVVCPAGAVKMRWDGDWRRVQEKMAEYASAVGGLFREKAVFLNYLLHVTKDCDCMSQKPRVIARDVGILGSRDPVATDKAAVELLLQAERKDVLKASYEADWSVQLEHAEQIGLGTTNYELVNLD